MRHLIIIVLFCFSMANLFSQNATPSYNLQECIDMALENNLDLSLANLGSETAEVNFKRSRNALLPGINGTYNIGSASGRSINPFTNTYIDERLTFSNAGLSLDLTVFNLSLIHI